MLDSAFLDWRKRKVEKPDNVIEIIFPLVGASARQSNTAQMGLGTYAPAVWALAHLGAMLTSTTLH